MENLNQKLKIAVIGAGASGLMAAGFLAQSGHDVTVFDGKEKAGKKIYITGKGRCNITNLCAPQDFLLNVVRGEKFLRSAIYNFSSQDAVDFFENLGLKTKVERGNRVFPVSDKASDVTKVLKEKHCRGVKFCFNDEVEKVVFVGGAEILGTLQGQNEENSGGNCEKTGFLVTTKSGKYVFDRVIVATGGKSYSSTGSTGAGYKIAQTFGHNIVQPVPALCPIRLKDKFVKKLQGVSLKNVQLNAVADGKKLSFFGEMLFMEDGISGPIVLSLSSHINRAKKVELSLNFKPALTEKQVEARVLRDFESSLNKEVKSVLKGLLPASVAEVFEEILHLTGRKVNSITKEERARLCGLLQNFPLAFSGLYALEAAVVTSGGVDTKEIDPKTFESKLQRGLYFVGEVLDVDALTGGFNLQIAWATAASCARNMK